MHRGEHLVKLQNIDFCKYGLGIEILYIYFNMPQKEDNIYSVFFNDFPVFEHACMS